jgi:hypothetical protein
MRSAAAITYQFDLNITATAPTALSEATPSLRDTHDLFRRHGFPLSIIVATNAPAPTTAANAMNHQRA